MTCCSVVAMDVGQWRINELGVNDGLPDTTVYSMAQDQAGFMWFGTTNGVARYDGYAFRVFQHDGADEGTISNNNAGNVFIDGNNQLWIGTFGGGANKIDLNTGHIHRFPYTSHRVEQMLAENVQTFYQDISGHIWVGTSVGLYKMDNDQPIHMEELISDDELSHSRIWDITGDPQGHIWAGTSVGLIQLNQQNKSFQHFTLPDELNFDITSNQFRVLKLHQNTLWIGSASGLYEFDIRQQTFRHHQLGPNTVKINDLLVHEDHLLIASMSGLYQFDLQAKAYTRLNGQLWQAMNHLDIRALYADPSGLLWLATRDSGVLQLDPQGGLFGHHLEYLNETDMNEKSKQVWALEISHDQQLLLGTSDAVFQLQDNQLKQTIRAVSQPALPGIIRDIATTADGNWLVGSEGVFWQPLNAQQAEYITDPFDLVGMEPTDVFSVAVSQAGELWLALYNIGVLRWHPDTSHAELIQHYDGGPLNDLNLSHVFVDSNEDIWVASGLVGLFRYRLSINKLELFSYDFAETTGLMSNRIRDVLEDSSGRLWVATERGLNQFDHQSQSFHAVMPEDPVIGKSIYAITEDSRKNLWLTHQFGVSRMDLVNQAVNHYQLNEGFMTDGFIPRAVTIDDNDILYFGSVNGYYTFNPNELGMRRTFQPGFLLTEVAIDDRPLPFSALAVQPTEFKIDHTQRTIAFTMAALDYKSAGQIQYQYQLKGLHDDWLNVSKSRQIEFSQLNPGDYQLALRAVNNDGSWQDLTKNISMAVLPVWWERSWVRALLIMAVLLLAWAIHFYRTLKIRQQNQKLEAEVQKRTAELSEANAKLKAAAHSDYLTGLNNRMAFVSGFEEKRKALGQSRKNSTIVMADIDHFKLINDQYGHAAGDEVLKQVSLIMKAMIREGDLMARWGGEEFIFYFDRMDAVSTQRLIERIRQRIEQSDIRYEGHLIPVTLTFGVCQQKAGQSLNDCINAADDALYQGKKSGRNQVVVNQS
ncbi:diguanylate cyclase [Marinicella sediminis]|uniref:diguanylate cyclase n=1 Tax=Marinicella sediminis TaxID=1792834 RepID=A0ABV7JF28_9GAMM|nr:ligand-binding sensor domain-containing diguanylate cyclase [Marinicella sediminis]